jgi:hypothetical protein
MLMATLLPILSMVRLGSLATKGALVQAGSIQVVR